MYYDISLFHLFVLLLSSTGFLAQRMYTTYRFTLWPLCNPTSNFLTIPFSLLLPDWFAIGKIVRIAVADVDNNAENQWTFVPRRLNRSSPTLKTEEHAATKREALRAILSKAFLAKVTLCAIATTSLITSVLNFGFVQSSNHTFVNKDYMRRIERAYEKIANDNARKEWEEQSGSVDSAAFVMKSYYFVLVGGFICK
jgi:hypothetical protein